MSQAQAYKFMTHGQKFSCREQVTPQFSYKSIYHSRLPAKVPRFREILANILEFYLQTNKYTKMKNNNKKMLSGKKHKPEITGYDGILEDSTGKLFHFSLPEGF